MADSLLNGTSALLAYQNAIATVSHNVANATTKGYSRQRVDLQAQTGAPNGALTIGAGVAATRIQRLADNLVFFRTIDANGEVGRLDQLAGYASRVDNLITNPATGIAGQWSGFFAAAQDVVNEPTSAITRSAMISAGNQLATRWGAVDNQLTSIDRDANEKLVAQVGVANQLASQVANLNKQILAGGKNVNPNLLDQRATALSDLSRLVGGTIVDQGDGQVSVFTDNGIGLVMGTRAMQLATEVDPFNPQRAAVMIKSPTGTLPLGLDGLSGEVGGILEFRATVLDPSRTELNRHAAAFATAFNQDQTTSVDYNGDLGTAFFSIPAPAVPANPKNTGTAAFTGQITDLGAFNGQDVLIKFDGSAFQAVEPGTGSPVPMTGSGSAADPFVINGVSLTLSGAANAGDSFLLQPAKDAAAQLAVLINDPTLVAAASPMTLSVGAGNRGAALGGENKITDLAAFAGFAGASIEFLSPTSYRIDGGAPIPFANGDTITGPGWSLKLDGAPAAGDTFSLAATGARSADNAGARAFGALDGRTILDGGQVSLTNAMAQFTAKVGSTTQQAELNLDAQELLSTQIEAEREALSGVNLDEEAANLLKFQQAYQAAAQVIAAADQMFEALMAATRR